jgi:glycosyltransferase involved in cell wall biosynthesis
MTKITVILCTYNRCRSLAKALESVALSSLPASVEWEVLVIDNNSKDETRSVVERYCQRYPARFRFIFQPRQGKSYALNTGIREARGDVLAFMDDDVEVDPHWLRNLTDPLNDRKWAGAGGRILPEVGFTPPNWMETNDRYALGPLAIFDLGLVASELGEAPFGTNMAFRKEMFLKHGDFRTDLGPQPGSEIRSEDAEFGERLLMKGERFWYEPSAVVYHAIPPERVKKTYFLAWWFDKARADVRQYGTQGNQEWRVCGIPLYLLRRLVVWTVRWMVSADAARRFYNKVQVWKVVGTMTERYQQAHRDHLES